MDSAKNIAKSILATKESAEPMMEEAPAASSTPTGLVECMSELQAALSAGDFEQAAKVFESAFSVLEAAPHAEVEAEDMGE